jgi:hypothetical protein
MQPRSPHATGFVNWSGDALMVNTPFLPPVCFDSGAPADFKKIPSHGPAAL